MGDYCTCFSQRGAPEMSSATTTVSIGQSSVGEMEEEEEESPGLATIECEDLCPAGYVFKTTSVCSLLCRYEQQNFVAQCCDAPSNKTANMTSLDTEALSAL